MTERILRARFEGDSSGLKRMAQEGKQAIDSIVDAQEKASREWTDIVREAETEATAVVKQGTERRASEVEKGERRAGDAVSREAKRRLDTIQREVNETIKAIEKLPISREEKERHVAKVVENGAKKASQTVQQELRRQEQAYQQAAKSGLDYGGVIEGLGKRIVALAGAYVSLQTLMRGIQFNAQLETLSLGVASIVSANQEITDGQGRQIEGAEKLAIVQGQVAQVFKDLKQDAINTTATLPQLVESFNAAVGPAMAMGLSLDETRALTVQLVQTMGAMGIPLNQSRQEIQSILQGTIDNNSVLAKNLGITNDQVKAWAQQGTLVQSLLEKTKDFGAAGKLAGETWDGLTSTMVEGFDTLLGRAMAGPAEALKDIIRDVNEVFEDAEVEGTIGQTLNTVAESFGSVLSAALREGGELAGDLGMILLKGAEGWANIINQYRWLFAQNTGPAFKESLMKRLDSAFPALSGAAGPGATGAQTNGSLTAFRALAQRGADAKTLQDFINRSAGKGLESATDRETRKALFQMVLGAQQDADGVKLANLEGIVAGAQGKIQSAVDMMGSNASIKTKGAGTEGNGDKSKPLEGLQLLSALHKAGDLTDEQYLARLNVELGKVVKNSSDYFAIREKIAGLKSDPWLEKIFEQSPGALDFRLGQFMQGNIGASLPITTLADRIGGAFEVPAATLGLGDPGAPAKAELFGPGYGKAYDEFLKREATKLQKLAEDADKALQSGLEAGLSAFLDGGIGNLGEATYSLSKDAFSKALVEGIMSSEVKDAVGALGESLGAALQHPVTAAIAVAAMGLNEIKKAFDGIERHNQGLADLKRKYSDTPFAETTSASDLRQMAKERAVYAQEAERDVGLFGALMGFGHTKSASQKKLGIYDSMIPALASQAFDESWQGRDKAIDSSSLAEALAATEAAAWSFATANGLSVEVSNQLIEAKRGEVKAAWDATQAAKDFAASMSSYGGLMKSFDWQERLGGGPMDSTDLRYAGIAATGGRLDIGNIDQGEAVRLAELYGLMQYGGDQGAAQYGVGMVKPKSTREQIIDIIGYDPGFEKDKDGKNVSDHLLPLLDQMVLPMLAKMQDLTGGGQTQAIGSLNNPDHALRLDAPVNRVNNFQNQVVINTYAITGDKASFRDLVVEIMAEANTVQGQSV